MRFSWMSLLVGLGIAGVWATDLSAQPSASAEPAAVSSPADTLSLTDAEKIVGLSTIWKEAAYNFAFFDQVPDLDWNAAYQQFLPQVLATTSTYEYYRVLQRFAVLLGDGHTGVRPPKNLDVSAYVHFPALRITPIERRAFVDNVAARLEGQIPIGSEILTIDGRPVDAVAVQDVFPYLNVSTEAVRWEGALRGNPWLGIGILAGAPGSTAELRLELPDGTRRTVRVDRQPPFAEVDWARPVEDLRPPEFELTWLDGGIARVNLNAFMEPSVAATFFAHLPELLSARGLLIDLRRNHGGNSGHALAIARRLTADSLALSTWKTPIHIAAVKAWGGEAWDHVRDDFDQVQDAYREGMAWMGPPAGSAAPADTSIVVPTVVLIGSSTASAAEDFLVMLDGLDHVTLVGMPTNGSTGQPLFVDLPGGGTAFICTKRDTYPDGRTFVGVGIQPDVRVATTPDDLRSGRDAVLERGVEVLRQKIGIRS